VSANLIDTNVAKAANQESPQASQACIALCATRLELVLDDKAQLVVDNYRQIVSEYMQNLYPDPNRGLGDKFLKWVLTNLWNQKRCIQVPITPQADSFVEFPLDERLVKFDPRDRKWIATARAYRLLHGDNAPILEALDEKWKLDSIGNKNDTLKLEN
jgi:hypothetical protein